MLVIFQTIGGRIIDGVYTAGSDVVLLGRATYWLRSAWTKRREFGRHPHPDAAEWISLQRALRELPPNQRDAIVLHYLADLPVARVAEELDAQPGTVRVWLSRGRVRLGVLLDEDKEPRHA